MVAPNGVLEVMKVRLPVTSARTGVSELGRSRAQCDEHLPVTALLRVLAISRLIMG